MLVNLQKTRRAWTIQEAPEDRKKKKKKEVTYFSLSVLRRTKIKET